MALDALNSSSSPSSSAAPAVDLGIYILVIIQFIIGIFGIFMNSFVVYVTIKNKKFRKLTNYLLGFICFYDAVYGTPGIVPFITMTGRWQIPLNVCFFLASPSTFCVFTSLDLMLFLGLERLVSVLFPIWYHSRADALKNLAFPLLVLCSLKNSYIFYICFQYVSTAPDLLVYCQSSDVIQGDASALVTKIGLISNICTVVIYLCLWAIIKTRLTGIYYSFLHKIVFSLLILFWLCNFFTSIFIFRLLRNRKWHVELLPDSVRKIGTGNPGLGHQINRSIFVLVIINLGFWLTSLIGTIVIPALPFDNAVTKLFYVRLILQLPRLATLLNAPVLYFCSSEYRSAFRKEMRRFIGCPYQSTLSTNPNGVVNPGIAQQQHQRNANQQQQWQGGHIRQQQPMINNMMMPITSSN